MRNLLTRYALPTVAVTACALVIAPVIAQPEVTEDLTEDLTEAAQVTEPVERSTVSPDVPVNVPVIEVTASEPEEVDCYALATSPDDGSEQWLDCWVWLVETSETDEEQEEAHAISESNERTKGQVDYMAPVEHSTPVILPNVTLTNCTSDGPGDEEAPCYWDASENGDSHGTDFILWTDGTIFTP